MSAPINIRVHADRATLRDVSSIRPSERNARTHSKAQIRQLALIIERFGYTQPVLVDANGTIIGGHARLEAAKLLGMTEIPVIKVADLTSAEVSALMLADNKLALNASWDEELLSLAFGELESADFDLDLTGFSTAEIDIAMAGAAEASATNAAPEDDLPAFENDAASRSGDIWVLGRHRLLCGDAQEQTNFTALMGGKNANIMFTDPPYNVPIAGHVSGLGTQNHREFAFASGEMTSRQFTSFLERTLGNAACVCADGAIAYVCMDWRHAYELQGAVAGIFSELKNICIWNKTNGGMGTFYRSKHEFVFVYKVGTAPHTNNFGLGDTGRYRTNVWDYAGINSFGKTRTDELAMYPTVKPVAMVADALRDCSKRGGIVLDPFGGSGSTLIAAEITGRAARLIEFDPLYCDTIVRRFQNLTGKVPHLELDGRTFEEVCETRLTPEQACD